VSRDDVPKTTFKEIRTVVAIVPYGQRDEPPGRSPIGYERVQLAHHEKPLHPNEVEGAIDAVQSAKRPRAIAP
jgi:hypothetical protein